MKAKKIIAVVLVMLMYGGCENGLDSVPGLQDHRGYADIYIDDFRCGLFIPPDYDPDIKYPVIIFLHGYSDTTTWPLPWYSEPWLSDDPAIVLTPKCPITERAGWGDSWSDAMSPSLAKAFAVLDQVENDFSVDKSRYLIYGSSMGGIGTFAALKHFPERFAGAFVECARGNTDIAPLLVGVPLWMFHGSEDRVVPVNDSRRMYAAVQAAGGRMIRYTEYEGVGHDVWNFTPNETTLLTWFRLQQRDIDRAQPGIPLHPVFETDDDGGGVVSWDLPDADLAAPDDRIWYVRIYKNDTPIAEVYDNVQYFHDADYTSGDHYQISGVNFYFLESNLYTAAMIE